MAGQAVLDLAVQQIAAASAAPVYVDAAIHSWRGKLWCHLFCADLDRLHEFARKLGLRREWFQEPPKASWPHYDITAEKRLVAIRMCAAEATNWRTVLVSKQLMVAWCRVHRPDCLAEAERALRLWQQREAANLQRHA